MCVRGVGGGKFVQGCQKPEGMSSDGLCQTAAGYGPRCSPDRSVVDACPAALPEKGVPSA